MRPIAAGALMLALLIADSAAAQGPSRPPGSADRLGRIESAPVLVPLATMQLRNNLTILRVALEGYRAGHFYRYPEAGSPEALIALLMLTGDLPEGYRLAGTVTEFVANAGGYRISARTGDETLTIRPPERFDPFWAMLW